MKIKLWNINDGTLYKTYTDTDKILALQFIPTTNWLLAGMEIGSQVKRWDITTDTFSSMTTHTGKVTVINNIPYTNFYLVATDANKLYKYDYRTGS